MNAHDPLINKVDPQMDLIRRIGEQMEALQRSRAVWFVLALAGWATSAWMYFD